MSKDEELKELGNMLAATKIDDIKRLEAIIKRLVEIANETKFGGSDARILDRK